MLPNKIEVINKETGEVRYFTETEFYAERDRLLHAWEASKLVLEKAKEDEMKLRVESVRFAFDPNKKSGTERIELGGGWQAKAVKKINFGWIKKDDKVDKHAIDDALDAIAKLSPAGEYIAEHLVKWTPDLSKTEYDKLGEAEKTIIDKVIVTTEGAPTLEIIPPKGTK